MSQEFTLVQSLALASSVFIPTFIIAAIMLRSAGRGLALSAVFTLGAAAGFFGARMLGTMMMRSRLDESFQQVLFLVLISAGAIAGGVLAVYLLGKFSKAPPWRRS